MPGMTLPPGFRFHPTDEELVDYYLKKRVKNVPIEFDVIADVDLYKCEPWDLPSKSKLPQGDNEWFFFSPRDRKYPNGSRTNRATEAGYWKATGRDRTVRQATKTIGMKKTLVFYRGRAPHGERTDWLMHEYRLDGEEFEHMNVPQDAYVLCRVFKKNGFGPPKNPSGGSGSMEEGDQVDSPGEVSGKNAFADQDIKPSLRSLANLHPLSQPVSRQEVVSVDDHGANGADNLATRPQSIFSDDPFVHNGSFRIHFNPDAEAEGFFVDEGLDKMRNDEELQNFYEICPPLEGSTLQLGDEDVYDTDMPGLIDSSKNVRNEFHRQWQEQLAGAHQAFGGQMVPKQEDLVLPPLLHENDFEPLPTLIQLPSPPTASQSCEENDTESSCVSSSNNNFATIYLRNRPSSITTSAVVNGFASAYTAPRRVLFQQRAINSPPPRLASDSPPMPSAGRELSDPSRTMRVEAALARSFDHQAPTPETSLVDTQVANKKDDSWVKNVLLSPAPEALLDRGAVHYSHSPALSSAFVAPAARERVLNLPKLISEDQMSVDKLSSKTSPSVDVASQESVVDEASENEIVEKEVCSQETVSGVSCVTVAPAVEKVAEMTSPSTKPLVNESNPVSIMGSVVSKQKTLGELPPGFGSIQVNSVTVTCSCSSAGLPHVPTKACACYPFWEGRREMEKSTKEESIGGQASEARRDPAASSSIRSFVVGIVLSVLCVLLFPFLPAFSGDLSRGQVFLSFRDVVIFFLGAVCFSVVQRCTGPSMQLIIRRRRGVYSKPSSSDT